MKGILIDELRAAYDAQLRGVTLSGGSARIEKDGPLIRVVGWHSALLKAVYLRRMVDWAA